LHKTAIGLRDTLFLNYSLISSRFSGILEKSEDSLKLRKLWIFRGKLIQEHFSSYTKPDNFSNIIFQHKNIHLQGVLLIDKLCYTLKQKRLHQQSKLKYCSKFLNFIVIIQNL